MSRVFIFLMTVLVLASCGATSSDTKKTTETSATSIGNDGKTTAEHTATPNGTDTSNFKPFKIAPDLEGTDRFVIAGTTEKIVQDTTTNLIWQQDFITRKTWQEAIDYCDGLSYSGFTDWVLPNYYALQSLVDYSKRKPALDNTFFPGETYKKYWSSSSGVYSSTAWHVDFYDGWVTYSGGKDDYRDVRCVRQESEFDYLILPFFGYAKYEEKVATDGKILIIDKMTGKNYTKEFWSDARWDQALEYCDSLEYGGYTNWRLPTIKELASLVNLEKKDSSTDFPGSIPKYFWASTSYQVINDEAWNINFRTGHVGAVKKNEVRSFWCVLEVTVP